MKDTCSMCLGIGEVYHVQLDAVSTCLVCKGEGTIERDEEDELEDNFYLEDSTDFIEFDENEHSLNDDDGN